jgi:hypothetical protein
MFILLVCFVVMLPAILTCHRLGKSIYLTSRNEHWKTPIQLLRERKQRDQARKDGHKLEGEQSMVGAFFLGFAYYLFGPATLPSRVPIFKAERVGRNQMQAMKERLLGGQQSSYAYASAEPDEETAVVNMGEKPQPPAAPAVTVRVSAAGERGKGSRPGDLEEEVLTM